MSGARRYTRVCGPGRGRAVCGCHPADPQGQPIPYHMRFYMRASMRGKMQAEHGGRFHQHPGTEESGGGFRRGSGPAGMREKHRQEGSRTRGRSGRTERGLLSSADGAPGNRIRDASKTGGNASLRHTELPSSERPAGGRRKQHPEDGRPGKIRP